MVLVTGYAVYLGGARSNPAPSDGVSGGSLTIEFDPDFAQSLGRGIVNYPELGKRDGGFFSLEGICYFVADNQTGLPSEFEGRVIALTCASPQAVDLEEAAPIAEEAAPNDKDANSAISAPQSVKNLPSATVFYDMPEPEDFFAQPKASSPDTQLAISLRSALVAVEDAGPETTTPLEPITECAAPVSKSVVIPPEDPSPDRPDWMATHLSDFHDPFAAEPIRPDYPVLAQEVEQDTIAQLPAPEVEDDSDPWDVYLEPYAALSPPHFTQPEVITPFKSQHPAPLHNDEVSDLVLIGSEKEVFEVLAEDVVETIDSFETIKRIDEQEGDAPLLIAELRKLDPNAPDLRPHKLLPWLRRDETEEEMVERLTIKTARYAI